MVARENGKKTMRWFPQDMSQRPHCILKSYALLSLFFLVSINSGFQRLGAFGLHFAKACSFVLPTPDFDISFFDWEHSSYFMLKVENNISSKIAYIKKQTDIQLLFTYFKQHANCNPSEPPNSICIPVVIGTVFFHIWLSINREVVAFINLTVESFYIILRKEKNVLACDISSY